MCGKLYELLGVLYLAHYAMKETSRKITFGIH